GPWSSAGSGGSTSVSSKSSRTATGSVAPPSSRWRRSAGIWVSAGNAFAKSRHARMPGCGSSPISSRSTHRRSDGGACRHWPAALHAIEWESVEDQMMLYDADDLRIQVERNLANRHQELERDRCRSAHGAYLEGKEKSHGSLPPRGQASPESD